MSRNIYLGADLMYMAASTNQQELGERAASVYGMVQATDFSSRARALALEVERTEPMLIGLQEVALWRRSPVGVVDGPATPAKIVVYDFLEILMSRLAARSLDYEVVVRQATFDLEVPSALGHDIRLTQRNVILARSDLPRGVLRLSNPRARHFDDNTTYPSFAGSIEDTRGWTSVDVVYRGRSFRFINTHLDSFVEGMRLLQAQELIDGPAGVPGHRVLVGDMNDVPTSATLAKLGAAGLRDGWALVRRGPGYTFGQDEDLRNVRSKLDRRIDYVLASRGIDVRFAQLVGHKPWERVAGLWPSDHAGVVVTLAP
jgi:endonuclease/exonuclease/phosphatase family metal-dependent hydrolase